ncbi:MAG TPA: hypothetical protein VF986_00505 [Actinomycetota bacterium]
MKLDKVARAAVPNEPVMAAGIFQAAGSMTARHSGFGEFSVRRREREERASSGLSFKRYMLLVLTPSRLHIFDASSAMTRWKANRSLATWDRSAIRATADTKSMTVRLTLEIPSENRRIELEAPKARRGTSGEVARLLGSSSPSPVPQQALASQKLMSSAGQEQAERLRKLHNRPGWLAIAGAAVRLLAYAMPWIVIRASNGSHLNISGWRALGKPWLSIAYPIVIIVAGGFYLAGRREGSPRLLLSLGVGSIVVFLIQYPVTTGRIAPLKSALTARGAIATVSLGFGLWVELAGAIMILAGGLYAYMLWKNTLPPQRSYVPPIPAVSIPARPDASR